MRALSASFRRGARQDSASHQQQTHQQQDKQHPDARPSQAPTPAPRLTKARSITLFSKAPKQPLETSPPVPFLARVSSGIRPDLTPASSASSDGSASLRTPEDEGLMSFPSSTSKQDDKDKKKWPAWLPSWRRSADRDPSSISDLGERLPPHSSHRPLGISTQTVNNTSSSLPRRSQSDTEDDSSDDEYDEDDAPTPVGRSAAGAHAQHIPTRAQVLQAQSNVRVLLRNNLIPVAIPPPLVDGAQCIFPTSTYPAHRAQRGLPLEQILLTRRSLQRLDRRPLTLAEARSLAPFANRPKAKPAGRVAALGIERTNKTPDYESVADVSLRVGRFSRGVRRWATRPCFEQRFRVWQPDASGEVVPSAVTGVERAVAICDLEYSEWVEQLAGLAMDNGAFEAAIARSFHTLPRKHSPPPRNSLRRSAFNRHPSPLRVEPASPAEPVVSPVSSNATSDLPRGPAGAPLATLDLDLPKPLSLSAPLNADSPTSSAGGSSTSKEDDDNVPLEYLGYAMLAKKRKEEKERFLAAEREKRELNRSLMLAEEAKRKMEADRRRAEEDAQKQKVALAEEIAAVRRRRENARLGVEAYDNIREMNRMTKGESYSRPAYDISPQPASANRRASGYFPSPESPLERTSNTPSPHPQTPEGKEKSERRKSAVLPSSPAAIGKPSVNAAPLRPSASRHTSMPRSTDPVERPDSVISSTSSANVRRASLIRSSSAPNTLMAQQQMPVPPMMPYSMMPMQAIPPVPPMPVWNMNLGMGMPAMPPLVMPTAPFMMQHSPHSGSPSPVSGSPGTGNPFSSGSINTRSRSGSRSRDQKKDPSPSRRQSTAGPASSLSYHHHAQQQQQQQHYGNNVPGGGAGSTRSRHSIYSQAAAANASGSYVSLNRSSSHLVPGAGVGSTGAGGAAAHSAASRSPSKRMSVLAPHSPSPLQQQPSLPLPHSSSKANMQRRSVHHVNVVNGAHALAASGPAPHAKRRSTMMM